MRKSLKAFAVVVLVVVCVVMLAACDANAEYYVLGTFLEIKTEGAGGAALADEINAFMQETELAVSTVMEGSDIYAVNAAPVGEAVACRPVTMEIVKEAEYVYDLTDGAYDPSVFPLVELWGFSPDKFVAGAEGNIPTDEDIAATLEKVGFRKCFSVDYEKGTVTKLVKGAKLDLGGIAKGYAVEKALSEVGKKQKALVNLGGNIGAANKTYRIGISAPREYASQYFAVVELYAGECIATSGDYQRCFIKDGVRYHHIINPFTGRPADSGVAGASVISSDGALGDALATAVVVAGTTSADKWVSATGCSIIAVNGDMAVSVFGGRTVECV